MEDEGSLSATEGRRLREVGGGGARRLRGDGGWRRAVQVLRDSNRWRPALRCTAVPGRCARVHKHLLARPQIPWAGQPNKLPAEVCLESTAGLDAVGHRYRIFLHAARTRRDLHMQRARRARTVRHDDHRKLPIKGSLELLAGPNTGGDRDREGLHHRVGAASHGGLRSSCRIAEGGARCERAHKG